MHESNASFGGARTRGVRRGDELKLASSATAGTGTGVRGA